MAIRRFPRKSSLRRAKNVLEGVVTPSLKEGIILADMALRWKDIVGYKIANYSMPVSIESGVLVVVASSPGAAHHVSMMGASIAQRIKELWGLEIKGVRSRVGKVRRNQPPRQKRKLLPVEIPKKLLEEKKKAFEGKIGRKDAEEALARLSALYEIRFGRREKKD
ncbi:protein of unknown function DUF721 [Thermovirga lienii DSM 17291]|jgi:hypothetical protein|uniref:DUF721 domain-containing protein n=1 Tax=Thermovirga lienii (strain ATCC BAA-1197 / DSM 17291 / Cas60314) TaxID=580340 RepID=G7V551_THELD|nr:DUF721 domain-containing protein [Thermovirga lienii]AER65751.1 protein of unknown function DUF721 [Thermovirga lienii DSM 17291]MDN5319366.1 hypothetical protein [Thermovirga sp.]